MNPKRNNNPIKDLVESVNDVAEEVVNVKKPVTGEVVNCELLNLRQAPDKNSQVIGLLSKGEVVEIIEGANELFYKTPVGYVMRDFIKLQ